MSFVAMDRNKGCGYAAVARGLDLPPLQFLNNMLVYLKIGSKFNPQHWLKQEMRTKYRAHIKTGAKNTEMGPCCRKCF